jgi:HEPN domain-containing protein
VEYKYKPAHEWILQAEYDMETAETMHHSGRYIYAIFMMHLSIEKALKGIYSRTFKENPPKTHHLLYLIEKIQSEIPFEIPENIFAPIREIDKVSIPVRYPENLAELFKDYPEATTFQLLNKAKEVLVWLKHQ